jgi:hypothetical protein
MYKMNVKMSALYGGEWSASRPGHFTQGRSPWYPIDRRLGGPRSRSVHAVGEKNSHTPPRIELRSSNRPVLYRVILLKHITKKYGIIVWTGFI